MILKRLVKLYMKNFLEQRIKRIVRADLISAELEKAYKALDKTSYEKMSKKM